MRKGQFAGTAHCHFPLTKTT